MKKLNLKDIKNAMSRNEMRTIKGGSGGGASCNLTVVACYHYNYLSRNNAFNGPNGWQCCSK